MFTGSSTRRRTLNQVWIALVAASLALAVGLWRVGVASDCKPEEIDGQCGLSTGLGILYGAAEVVFVNLLMGVVAVALTFWWDRHPLVDEQGSD